jgi:hypothetical protein
MVCILKASGGGYEALRYASPRSPDLVFEWFVEEAVSPPPRKVTRKDFVDCFIQFSKALAHRDFWSLQLFE